jgi:hypothetical protein
MDSRARGGRSHVRGLGREPRRSAILVVLAANPRIGEEIKYRRRETDLPHLVNLKATLRPASLARSARAFKKLPRFQNLNSKFLMRDAAEGFGGLHG